MCPHAGIIGLLTTHHASPSVLQNTHFILHINDSTHKKRWEKKHQKINLISTFHFQMERELNLSPRAKPRYTGKVRLCVTRYK